MRISKYILLSALSILSLFVAHSEGVKYTLKGVIIDADSNEPIEGVEIEFFGAEKYKINSSKDGSFTLSIAQGRYNVEITKDTYRSEHKYINLIANRDVEWKIKARRITIRDVVVNSNSAEDKVASPQIGAEKIAINTMSKLPALLGERDIIRSLTLLPGVKQESEGSSGFEVRGGNPSQNMITLNDAPIYNSGHVMGIFSIFNDDVLQDATLYKGLIPAQFGGGTASVLDISTKKGSKNDMSFGADVGLLFSKAYVEGAIVKDKLSFIAAGRRSYFDMFLKLTDEYKNNVANFYDLNGVINYQANEDNVFTLSLFNGEDNLGFEDMMKMGWGNSASTLRWFRSYNSNLKSSTSLIWSLFSSDNGVSIANMDMSFRGYIENYSLKHNFTYTPANRKHTIDAGFQVNIIDLVSTDMENNGISYREQREGLEAAMWINDEWSIGNSVTLLAGVRANFYGALGGSPYYTIAENGDILSSTTVDKWDIVTSYLNFEPRISVNVQLDGYNSIKGGYSRTVQNIHAMRSVSSSSPFDRYILSSNILKPQIANQLSLGLFTSSFSGDYELSIEGYYKEVENVYDYKEGKDFNSEVEIERIILGGSGRSYGLEFMASKKRGRLTGWMGYTLSWSQNRIDGINDGEWYSATNDRRHDISIVAMYELSPRWSLSASWVYNTGAAISAPSAKYDVLGETYYYYAERNGYRAPASHRLDVGVTLSKERDKYSSEWRFGFYNLYNRYNPYMINFVTDESSHSGMSTVQYSLFGILPSVSYSIRF